MACEKEKAQQVEVPLGRAAEKYWVGAGFYRQPTPNGVYAEAQDLILPN